jgi:hypothetical protein
MLLKRLVEEDHITEYIFGAFLDGLVHACMHMLFSAIEGGDFIKLRYSRLRGSHHAIVFR